LQPYGLDRLEVVRAAKHVYLVEGESDCWALWYYGLPALGVPGSNSARTLTPECLEGIETVYIHQEPDRSGETFVKGVADRLKELGYRGRVFIWSCPDGVKDPADLHAQNTDPEQFKARLRVAIEGSVPLDVGHRSLEPGVHANDPDIHLTDLGNARRVVERHGQDLRYCHSWKRWQVWDGRCWAEDQTGEVVRRIKDTQGELYRATAAKIDQLAALGDDAERKARLAALTKLLKHSLDWENAKRIAACQELMKSELGIPVVPAELDADPFLLNVLNGTLDLRTGRLREHRREDLITKLAPVTYDSNARCPQWDKCLDRIMAGNTDLIGYLQRVIGYCLTGDVSEQCLWFLYGSGQNGKSTFLATLLALLGDYGCQAVSELLMVRKNEQHPTERADLFGKRFVATIETEEGKRLAESLMKQLTGGDKIRARRLYQDHFEFKPTHKLFLAANHKPTITGTDFAVWRRIKLVPFTVTIPEEEKDKALPQKLEAELPGILAWAVRGCLDWQQHGLGEPDEVRQATAEYQAEQDTLARFLTEGCFLHAEARVKASTLFEVYQNWSGDKVMTQCAFGKRLREKGYVDKRGTGGAYFWHGIGLDAGTRDRPGPRSE
jgi:putative DNA primase/helicase